jgi:hypothetical protein
MDFHKFPSAVIIYILLFAVIYTITSNHHTGLTSFIDAVSYSFTTTFSIKNNEINATTDTSKSIHIVQKLLAFISLYSAIFLTTKSIVRFGIINIAILVCTIMLYSRTNRKVINTDLVYKFVNNHTLTEKYSGSNNIIILMHMLVVVFTIYKFNNGIFKIISDPLFGRSIKQLNTIAKLE